MRSHDDVAQQITVEQEAVDALYARLDAEVSAARAARDHVLATPVDGPQSLYARDVEIDRLTRRVEGLRAAERSLCVGRIDTGTGESVRIGRIGLRSEHGEVLVVDWRADAARPFYAATPASPLGLRRRRHLRLCGRTVVDVRDELLDGSAPAAEDVVGDGPLTAVLSGARTGRMREAVATLQAEQDAIVRSPHRGVTVVDGGPGTGKTIVALHRAAYVLYAFPFVAERGVLVFGPNRRFLDYISDVLPSLGENDVRMATLSDLAGTDPTATESDAAARAKGRARLAASLARWVRGHQPHRVSLDIRVGRETITLDSQTVDEARHHATNGGLAHNPAREAFKEHVVDDLVSLLETRTAEALAAIDDEVATLLDIDLDQAVAGDLRALGLDDTITTTADPEVDWEALRDRLRDDPGLDLAIDAVWPRLRADQAFRDFLGDARGSGPGFTAADLALLDEARALIDGPPEEVYGHIVIDEAQELSEMQWRMLMRRCPSRSLTIVGDFAQAGAATTVRSWADALGPFVGERFAHHRLTVNYRTTAEILHATKPLLARIAPDQRLSRSVRHGPRPRTITVAASDLDRTLRDLVEQISTAQPDRQIGIIGPAEREAGLRTTLDGSVALLVAAPEARGLEFDTVIIIDPEGIETARPGGARDLYVARTRATQRMWTLRLRHT